MSSDGWMNWDAQRVAEEVRAHNDAYWQRDQPIISDYKYDRMVERLRHLAPEHPTLSELGGPNNVLGASVRHERAMLSLDKAYDEKALLHWASKFEGALVMSPKVDGVACSIRYENGRLKVAATRGSGSVGEDITQNVLQIVDVPRQLSDGPTNIEVRGEVYLPLTAFERVRDQLANPRNATAGALKQKNANRVRTLGVRFMAYDVVGLEVNTEIEKLKHAASWGFSTVEQAVVSRQEVQTGYERYVARRRSLDFEIDGVVFKANRLSEHARLGETAHHPRYAIAYKLQGDSGTTVLESIEWSISRTGVLTPVGLVAPVELSGAVVTRITLHHWGMVQSKSLTLGAEVVAMRRGGVIPHLEHVVKPGPTEILPPSECPSCAHPTLEDGDLIRCPNVHACPAQSVGVLSHYAKALGIEGFGDVWLDTFVDAGLLRSPTDFYTLTCAELIPFERMGSTLANKLIDEVNKSRRVPLETFIFALGLPDVGKSVAETVASSFGNLQSIRNASLEDFLSLPMVGPIVARNLRKGLTSQAELIDDLCRHIEVLPFEGVEVEINDLVVGKSFLFTGTLVAMKRGEAQILVKSSGGSAASGVSKSLDYLVVGDAGSAGSKLTKAESLGIDILTESAFLKLFDV
jgi:DNA ligase (NAD+)